MASPAAADTQNHLPPLPALMPISTPSNVNSSPSASNDASKFYHLFSPPKQVPGSAPSSSSPPASPSLVTSSSHVFSPSSPSAPSPPSIDLLPSSSSNSSSGSSSGSSVSSSSSSSCSSSSPDPSGKHGKEEIDFEQEEGDELSDEMKEGAVAIPKYLPVAHTQLVEVLPDSCFTKKIRGIRYLSKQDLQNPSSSSSSSSPVVISEKNLYVMIKNFLPEDFDEEVDDAFDYLGNI